MCLTLTELTVCGVQAVMKPQAENTCGRVVLGVYIRRGFRDVEVCCLVQSSPCHVGDCPPYIFPTVPSDRLSPRLSPCLNLLGLFKFPLPFTYLHSSRVTDGGSFLNVILKYVT